MSNVTNALQLRRQLSVAQDEDRRRTLSIFIFEMVVFGISFLKVSFASLFERFLKVRTSAKLMRSPLHLSHQFENAAFIL